MLSPNWQRPEEAIIRQVLETLSFTPEGLIPAIAQRAETGEILMMAWMNKDAVRETLETGRVCYWSRSRQSLWRKGESSGHTQYLHSFRYDCDGDTLLLLVSQQGPACHTFRPNCFFHEVRAEGIQLLTEPEK
jgi:phosphoribosyl-AMP cyclohydrolase